MIDLKHISLSELLIKKGKEIDLSQVHLAPLSVEIITKYSKQGQDFSTYLVSNGFSFTHSEDTESCHKMKNLVETADEFIIPVVLAKAMVQPYPARHQMMAKLPEDLEDAICVNYETGEITDTVPTFEFHPKVEKRTNENGYVKFVRYQADRERIVGEVHLIKKRLSPSLIQCVHDRDPLGVSIGFAYTEGPKGNFRGRDYDAAQKNIMITHLAIFSPKEATGRCPLPYCGVGLDHDALKVPQAINTGSMSEEELKRKIEELKKQGFLEIYSSRMASVLDKNNPISPALEKWRSNLKEGTIMPTEKFEEIVQSLIKEGMSEEAARNIAGSIYWKRAKRLYAEGKNDRNDVNEIKSFENLRKEVNSIKNALKQVFILGIRELGR